MLLITKFEILSKNSNFEKLLTIAMKLRVNIYLKFFIRFWALITIFSKWSILDISKSWIVKKGPFKMQDRSMYFYVTKYKKFTDRISNSTFRVNFKKVPFVEFWYSIKRKSTIIWKEYQSISPLPNAIDLSEDRFFSSTLTEIIYCNGMNEKIWESSCVILSHLLKVFMKI